MKRILCKALKSATSSITLISYGITDPTILKLLEAKKQAGMDIFALCDKRSSINHPLLTVIKKSGLTHAKILTIDDHLTFLGSANLTLPSLEMHENFLISIQSKPLTKTLKEMIEQNKTGHIEDNNIHLWLLPCKEALKALIREIDEAKSSIELCLFTLSHPQLIQALEQASTRGVSVNIFLDRYTKSPKTTLNIRKSRGPELLHHKWALIDSKTLVCGSVNWTQAGFSKNREILAIIKTLPTHLVKKCVGMCHRMRYITTDAS